MIRASVGSLQHKNKPAYKTLPWEVQCLCGLVMLIGTKVTADCRNARKGAWIVLVSWMLQTAVAQLCIASSVWGAGAVGAQQWDGWNCCQWGI